jgi:hypothetical protein
MDIARIQEKSEMARELIKKGLAQDYEEACNMIDEKGMVKNCTVEAGERRDQSANFDNDVHSDKRLEEIEKMISQVKDFVVRYTRNNDSNLRELDEKMNQILRKLSSGSSDVGNVEEKKQETLTPVETQKPVQKTESEHPQGKLNQEEFSVEKYFSNSHGRMVNK